MRRCKAGSRAATSTLPLRPRGPAPSPVADFLSLPDDESGRGLLIVAALADRWGSEPYPPSGKTVWAECDFRAVDHAY